MVSIRVILRLLFEITVQLLNLITVLVLFKVRKSRKHFLLTTILPKNEQRITVLSILGNTQDSFFSFFFGRIEDCIISFRDCLTFNQLIKALVFISILHSHKIFAQKCLRHFSSRPFFYSAQLSSRVVVPITELGNQT